MAAPDVGAGSPFWRFSLATYRKSGVAEACLALQDGLGVDVNVLLFVLWLGAQGRRLDDVEMQFVLDEAAGWAGEVVVPLRTVRRRLKDDAPLVATEAAQAFRTQVKRLELEAERLEQEALFGLAGRIAGGERTSPEVAIRANVDALARAMDRSFPEPEVIRLVAAARPPSAS
ncbi:MAG: TIGR02444 family protein [Rhodoplanes sp.]|uniref:TIGR02444 family protein n=1 Tax=Rhodoplanes sp. TaxID=1968906 RepID=UPI0017A80562|nr:TIGR02444 family protein [Rhodoplanes sp.]NVO13246.1 TIGR02444 family protein [Rhodoplanes sp.]